MDSFEWNKIIGAVLGTAIFIFVVRLVAENIYEPEKPAKPEGKGPFPGVVLIHHLPGWSELYIESTRRFAHHGYLAICANLYERAGDGNPDDVAAKVRADGGIPDAQIDLVVCAANGAAVAGQAAQIAGVSRVIQLDHPANERSLAAVLAPQIAALYQERIDNLVLHPPKRPK